MFAEIIAEKLDMSMFSFFAKLEGDACSYDGFWPIVVLNAV